MAEMRSLDLEGNDVADLAPLRGMAAVEWLDLEGNRVTEVSPLSGMTMVRFLDLNNNAIEDIGPLVDRAIFGGAASSGARLNLDLNPLSDTSPKNTSRR